MKTKVLRSIAKSLADMSTSDRVSLCFERVLDNHIKIINVDLMRESESQEGACILHENLRSWFMAQAAKQNIIISDLDSVSLEVEFDYEKVSTNLEKVALLHISSKCNISGSGKVIEGQAYNKLWYTRVNA